MMAIGPFRVTGFEVIDIGIDRKSGCDFLLVNYYSLTGTYVLCRTVSEYSGILVKLSVDDFNSLFAVNP